MEERNRQISTHLGDISWIVKKYDYFLHGISTQIHMEDINHTIQLNDGSIALGNTLNIYDFKTMIQREGHTDNITCIAQLLNGDIVTGSSDMTVRVWNSKTHQILGGYSILSLIVVGNTIVGGCDNGNIVIWKTYDEPVVLMGHTNSIHCFGIINQDTIISGSGDSTLRIWDINEEKCTHILTQHNTGVTAVLVLKDTIVSGSAHGDLIVWDLTGQYKYGLFKHIDTIQLIYPISEDHIAVGSWDGRLTVWSLKPNEGWEHTLHISLETTENEDADEGDDYEESNNVITSILKLPNGNLVIGSWNPTLYVYNPITGLVVDILEDATMASNNLFLLRDNRFVNITTSGEIIIWE